MKGMRVVRVGVRWAAFALFHMIALLVLRTRVMDIDRLDSWVIGTWIRCETLRCGEAMYKFILYSLLVRVMTSLDVSHLLAGRFFRVLLWC